MKASSQNCSGNFGSAIMHIASSLAVGLSVLSITAATGTVQLDFERDEKLARRNIHKRESSSNETGTAALQLFKQKLYFLDVSVCNKFASVPEFCCPTSREVNFGGTDFFILMLCSLLSSNLIARLALLLKRSSCN